VGFSNTELASAEVYVLTNAGSGAGTWIPINPLNGARAYHTATLLPNGKVLAAGGASPSFLNSAELYDPATGTWSATGALHTPRDVHTATLLSNGKVLVAGGSNGSGYTNSAELYNPATGTWSATGSLTTARGYHTATLLPNGKVLVAAGYGNGASEPLGSAELYDPGTRTWTAADNLNGARYSHSATLLPGGQVLKAGGIFNSSYLTSVDLFDAGLGFMVAWRPVVSSLTTVLRSGTEFGLGGSGFLGISEASGGGTNNSATDYPLVQLRRIDNEMAFWLSPDPAHPFSATAFTSKPPPALPAGHYLATVFANGIPSISQVALAPAPNNGAIDGPLELLLLDN
jgi:hypothetical protein